MAGKTVNFAEACSDIVTYTLESPTIHDRNRKVYIDIENPSLYLTTNHVRLLVRKMVAGLRSVGVQKGTPIFVHLKNNHLYPALFHGIIGSGAHIFPCNPALTVDETRAQLNFIRPGIIITSGDLLSRVQDAAVDLDPSVQIFILDAAAYPGDTIETACAGSIAQRNGIPDHSHQIEKASTLVSQPFQKLLSYGEEDWMRISDEEAAKNTVACYWSTSGTSGLPKAAMHSHYAMNARNIAWNTENNKDYDVVKYLTLPLFHGLAAGLVFMEPLRRGELVLISSRFKVNQFIETIRTYRVTETAVVPHLLDVLNSHHEPVKPFLSSLRLVTCAGGHLKPQLEQSFYEQLHPDAIISNLWGFTEVGACTMMIPLEKDMTGSVGRPVPGTELKLIDDYGNCITTDSTEGEIIVRSNQRMTAYLNNPEATAAIDMGDDWLRTGDIGIVCDGKYYIVDRKKDLIKVRGWQVAPAEVEAVLTDHPDIAEAAVVGLNVTTETGHIIEMPRAFVVRKGGKESKRLTEADVILYASKKLASYKKLTGGVVFLDHLPKTPLGKVRRVELRAINEKF